jgi:septum formation topological specificity factor MinE
VAFAEPGQVMIFLTELTERRGAVRTLDEMLMVRAQPYKEGFMLQVPKAKEVGGQYYLDEQIIAAAGSEFYSVSDRMKVIIPPDRLEQTLHVIMYQRKETLAVFDKTYKDIAREYLGIQLPELEVIAPSIEQPQAIADPPAPQEQLGIFENTSPQRDAPTIVSSKKQPGILEKRIARFLETAGIREAVTQGEDFHLKIENDPYIPLIVERHLDELYLTHYLEQNGDMFIDSEMIFTIQDNGQLRFKETAVQDPFRGGEARGADPCGICEAARIFAQVFSRNILEQGFAEAAREQPQEVESSETTPTLLNPQLQGYLELKKQYPDALVLVEKGQFYETYLDDARILADRLEFILSKMDSGDPSMGQVPLAGIPTRVIERYVQILTAEFTVVKSASPDHITIHPKQIQQEDLKRLAD